MILTCPKCSTRYQVDQTSLGGRARTVRCAHCGNRWLARPAPPELPAANVVDLPPKVAPVPPAPKATGPKSPTRKRGAGAGRSRRSGNSASLVGWLVGVLLVLITASVIIGRDEIVAGFPASAMLYQRLGLPVTVQLGLQFENVSSERRSEDGSSVLVVRGEVVNVVDDERPVPPIRITLLDADGQELYDERFDAEAASLAAGAKTSFAGRIVDPAAAARNFSVTFDVEP